MHHHVKGNLNSGEQITVEELIWEILEGDPREGAPDLEGVHPRAIKDDVRICLILDCCRCFTQFNAVALNSDI